MRPFTLLAVTATFLLSGTSAVRAGEGPRQAWESVVYADGHADTRENSLKVNGHLLQRSGKPREFTFLSLWRYDAEKKRWRRMIAIRDGLPITLRPEKRVVYSRKSDRELIRLPDQVGLFWAEWKEDDRRTGALVVSGPVLCNDVQIGDPPKGMIAACVPFADRAEAMFVPNPKVHCQE